MINEHSEILKVQFRAEADNARGFLSGSRRDPRGAKVRAGQCAGCHWRSVAVADRKKKKIKENYLKSFSNDKKL